MAKSLNSRKNIKKKPQKTMREKKQAKRELRDSQNNNWGSQVSSQMG